MNLPEFKQWAIVELMGHVRMAGLVTEEERFGVKLGRIEIPNGENSVTQYFNGSSLYRLTPTTEEVARAAAASNQPEPVHRWEIKQLSPAPVIEAEFPFDREFDDGDDEDEKPF